MGTLSLKRHDRDTPVRPDDVIPELAPKWDPKATFLGIGGVVGIAFMQGKSYFNCRKEFVKEVPIEDQRAMPAPPKAAVVQHRGVMHVGRGPNETTHIIPQIVADAQKENAQALAAESMSV